MAARIPPAFIDELLARVDIVDVIDSRVPLKKTGRELTACCPFHSEKTPSFTVSPDKQFYHCFGCGAHGSALGFLMDYEHLGFIEAVEELASGVGMVVPRDETQAPRNKEGEELYAVMEKAAGYYRQQLRQYPQATDYLKGRGLTGEIAAQFELGFAPSGWDNLLAALKPAGVTEAQLIQAGLRVKKDAGGSYDRFRGRIMFPIRDSRGRAIGFGGRVLDSQEEGPKYLNSAETPIFHKGRELYGLFQARKAERKLERLLVVEGYMDVVSLAQFGVRNVVATLGTATTAEHLERLFRTVSQVVFCFDGDRAGRQAAWRALEVVLPVLHEARQINFMFLPEGEDPDTLIRREGKAGFEARMATAVPFSDYFFAEMAGAVDLSNIDGRARLVENAMPLIAKLPEGVFRHMMVARLAELAKIDPGIIDKKVPSGGAKIHPTRPAPGSHAGAIRSPVRRAIQLLLHRPGLAAFIENESILIGVNRPGAGLLRELVELLHANPHLKYGAIIEHWRPREDVRHLAKLAAEPLMIPDDGVEAEFRDLIARLALERHEQTLDGLLAKAQLGKLSDEEKIELQQVLAIKGGRPGE